MEIKKEFLPTFKKHLSTEYLKNSIFKEELSKIGIYKLLNYKNSTIYSFTKNTLKVSLVPLKISEIILKSTYEINTAIFHNLNYQFYKFLSLQNIEFVKLVYKNNLFQNIYKFVNKFPGKDKIEIIHNKNFLKYNSNLIQKPKNRQIVELKSKENKFLTFFKNKINFIKGFYNKIEIKENEIKKLENEVLPEILFNINKLNEIKYFFVESGFYQTNEFYNNLIQSYFDSIYNISLVRYNNVESDGIVKVNGIESIKFIFEVKYSLYGQNNSFFKTKKNKNFLIQTEFIKSEEHNNLWKVKEFFYEEIK
ncbi:hypothetical protein CWI38_0014p0040 [Hamiltosporidium tvaerminnensis]|uniref:Uncharacterized protein n=1 Tax=Hamiltosporidium tvaerminnensis TaxID=1176355 RepID=A0A4V2JUZ2_9MICR|nr:hypothetical protein LUQ84_000484 [Hamiltosporidium tvaerminnensis]TBU02032.1 hypothetical protein CWI37_0572p0010 [Hamiltosporidium tvaerminnensis]TBU20869.1 hypothetical protein CWI38_0014p0040 [Hamiltosporidium tvaerminnensis]